MKKILSKIKKGAITAGLATALLAGGYKGVEYSSRKATRDYATQQVARFVQNQEEKLGVDYQRIPSITFGLYEDSNYGHTTYGLFDDQTGNIVINDRACVTSDSPIRNWVYGLFNKTRSIDYILNHELGHALVEEQLPKAGLSSFPNKALKDSRFKGTLVGQRMISEGIADYIASKMLNTPVPDANEFWSDDPQKAIYSPERSDFYEGGHALVAPILEKFGLEEGIQKLLKEVPVTFNRSSLRYYQERMLKE